MKKFLALALSLLMVVAMIPLTVADLPGNNKLQYESGTLLFMPTNGKAPVIDGTFSAAEWMTGTMNFNYGGDASNGGVRDFTVAAMYDDDFYYVAVISRILNVDPASAYLELYIDLDGNGMVYYDGENMAPNNNRMGRVCFNNANTPTTGAYAMDYATDKTSTQYVQNFSYGTSVTSEISGSDTLYTAFAEFKFARTDASGNLLYSDLESRLSNTKTNFGFIYGSGVVNSGVRIMSVKFGKQYTTSLTSTATVGIATGEAFTAQINATKYDNGTFNASEITFTYNPTYLTFNGITGVDASAISDNAGTVTFATFGTEKSNFVLNFTAKDTAIGQTATIAVTGAAYGTSADAAEADLAVSNLENASISVPITKEQFTVTYPTEWFTTESATVEAGGTFTMTAIADKYANYTYGDVTYGEGTVITPMDTDGVVTYTINNISSSITITANPTPKQHTVTIDNTRVDNDYVPTLEQPEDGSETATYNTAFTYTVPANVEPSEGNNWQGKHYTLKSVTYTGTETAVAYGYENNVITIAGDKLTAPITIMVEEKIIEMSQHAVTIGGNGASDGTAASTVVLGQASTLTVTPDAAYTYAVTATMGGETANVTDNGDNTYTVADVSGAIVFTITKTLKVEGLAVSEYVSAGDAGKAYLVTVDKASGADYTNRTFAYNGAAMLYSTDNENYAFLVISDTVLDAAAATAQITLIDGAATEYAVTKDANATGKTDANDAQFVANMYNGQYEAFNNTVSMVKFLQADNNNDGVVNATDAVAIVASLLG